MSLKNTFDNWIRKTLANRFRKIGDFEKERFFDEITNMLVNEAEARDFNEAERHQLVYRIQRGVMPEFVIADYGRVILKDEEFRAVFKKFSDDNWTSFERKWHLNEFLKLVRNVPGDFSECGVFRGGSAHFMCAEALLSNKHVHLFDSFEGLSAPIDGEDNHWSPGDLRIGEEEVRNNLAQFDNYSTYKGWIPERFGEVSETKFSLVHIDVDLQQPTGDAIEFFYPRLSTGGILLLDDHGSAMCPGARSVALDYFADQEETVLDLATGQGVVFKKS
ncbi:MAG: O-methyltransferase [Candidatus Azotimanducaceae bacterium]|jgi:O-methyltransferase